MRFRIPFFVVLFAFFWGSAQETPGNETEKTYVFNTEYQYREADTGALAIIFQFTENRFLKIMYGKGAKFILIDMEEGFTADNLNGKLSIEKIPEEPSSGDRKVELLKKGELRYKDYDCDIYHIMIGQELLKFYVEKKASENCTSMVAKFLSLNGMMIDESTIPKGRLIAGMEVKNGNDIDSIEIATIKENQNIIFTLNTN